MLGLSRSVPIRSEFWTAEAIKLKEEKKDIHKVFINCVYRNWSETAKELSWVDITKQMRVEYGCEDNNPKEKLQDLLRNRWRTLVKVCVFLFHFFYCLFSVPFSTIVG